MLYTLKYSKFAVVESGLVISYCSLDALNFLGGHTLTMEGTTKTRVPRFDPTSSTRKLEFSQATHLWLSSAICSVQFALRILQAKKLSVKKVHVCVFA